ncbi:MAG: uridine kinase [Clostridiaceae bacterium]|nr:uridine kinase [Clostridiaceae bacterium]
MVFKNAREEYVSYNNLISKIFNLPKKQKTLLIGIDGCGGAGKSTFAKKLSEAYSEITIVHMDDFYLPSQLRKNSNVKDKEVGAYFDWRRLKKQVLEPLSNDNMAKYQKYDWDKDSLKDCHEIKVGRIVIIEGVYSIRKELEKYYDFKIWIDTPRDLRLSRGIERDGEVARKLWEEEWMPAEDKYVKEHEPLDRADLIIDGLGK